MKRRSFLSLLSFMPFASLWSKEKKPSLILKKIPSSGEKIPAVGMGTWITFNVGGNQRLREARTEVLKTFFQMGGGLIDSSPMYGSAQEVLGYGLKKLNFPTGLFSADKIWTSSTSNGPNQFQEMQKLWGLSKFDLIQVHNLVNWRDHLKMLEKLKSEKKIRYIGITTSHGRRHDEIESIIKKTNIDFVQLTYNITHQQTSKRLIPLAKDHGKAVIINRPFDGGQLFSKVEGRPLPPWAKEFGLKTWADFFLKFIISHPGVTCAIPATSQVAHMKENMNACYGELLNLAAREKMQKYFSTIA